MRLAVGDDGQGFQRRLRQARRARLQSHQRDDPRREFGLADKLPRARHAGQAVAARARFVIPRNCSSAASTASSLVFLNGLAWSPCSAAAARQIAQFLWSERFLGGKQNGFQYQFKFHQIQAVTARRRAGARVISISPKSSDWAQVSCLSRINSSSAKKVQTTSGPAGGAANKSENFTAACSAVNWSRHSIFSLTDHLSSKISRRSSRSPSAFKHAAHGVDEIEEGDLGLARGGRGGYRAAPGGAGRCFPARFRAPASGRRRP